MLNFTFHNPVKLIFGKGTLVNLAKEIPSSARILITYGGGSIKRNGVYDQVKKELANYQVFEFGGIEPNPSYETLMQAVAIARKEKIDFLLAVGGGSVADGTKFIAAAVNYPSDPWGILTNTSFSEGMQAIPNTLPFGVILTLPATGSEMNAGAVISKKATKDKLAFLNANGFPQFSILDPTFTFSLPLDQTANGIVDAFVHVTEQYLTYPVNSPVQDRFAESILLTLIEEAPKVMRKPDDYEARANIMFSATMALNGILSMGVPEDWATHLIGHELTALFGIAHGPSLAIVLPSLLNSQREAKKAKLLQYASRVWGIDRGDESLCIDDAIRQTKSFFASLGIKTSLADYGVAKKDISAVVAKLKAHELTTLGERGLITLDVVQKILEGSY